jgi:hypothetical protein
LWEFELTEVAVFDAQPGVTGEALSDAASKLAIPLDGDDAGSGSEELSCQRPVARADFDNKRGWCESGRGHNSLSDAPTGEAVKG